MACAAAGSAWAASDGAVWWVLVVVVSTLVYASVVVMSGCDSAGCAGWLDVGEGFLCLLQSDAVTFVCR
jgi:hypothetical protein